MHHHHHHDIRLSLNAMQAMHPVTVDGTFADWSSIEGLKLTQQQRSYFDKVALDAREGREHARYSPVTVCAA